MQRRMERLAAAAAEREREERFRPETNPNSDRILEQSDKFAGKGFFERQVREGGGGCVEDRTGTGKGVFERQNDGGCAEEALQRERKRAREEKRERVMGAARRSFREEESK